jgi:hypothetical protein
VTFFSLTPSLFEESSSKTMTSNNVNEGAGRHQGGWKIEISSSIERIFQSQLQDSVCGIKRHGSEGTYMIDICASNSTNSISYRRRAKKDGICQSGRF